MISLHPFFVILLVSPLKSKSRLEAENAALRHQLIVLRRKASARVQLTNGDRLFLVLLYRWAFCRLQRLRHEPRGAHAAGLARCPLCPLSVKATVGDQNLIRRCLRPYQPFDPKNETFGRS
jgi:hypothetical protein